MKARMIVAMVLALVAGAAYTLDPVTTAAVLPGVFGAHASDSLLAALPALGLFGATNYVQEGKTGTFTAPYTVVSGAGAKIGNIFGVALAAIASGARGEFATEGVFDVLATTADTFAEGAVVYWDDTVHECTSTSSSNSSIGVAWAAKSGSATTVRVKLTGGAVA